MKRLDRRSFLKTSLTTTASLTLFPAFAAENGAKVSSSASASARVVGANGDLRYAIVGFNGRGKDHLKEMAEQKGTRLVALCDVDSTVLGRETAKCKERGQQVEGY